MGLSVWRETSKKLTVCRELFCPDNRVVCNHFEGECSLKWLPKRRSLL